MGLIIAIPSTSKGECAFFVVACDLYPLMLCANIFFGESCHVVCSVCVVDVLNYTRNNTTQHNIGQTLVFSLFLDHDIMGLFFASVNVNQAFFGLAVAVNHGPGRENADQVRIVHQHGP